MSKEEAKQGLGGLPSLGPRRPQHGNGVGFNLGFAKPGSKWRNVTQTVALHKPTIIGTVGKIQQMTQQEKEEARLDKLMKELASTLRAFDIFAQVNSRLQKRIADKVQRLNFGPGEMVYDLGTPVEDAMMIVTKGAVQVTAGNDVVVETVEAHEIFMPGQFVDHEGRSAVNVVTASKGECLVLKRTDLHTALFEADFTAALMRMKQLAREEKLLWKVGLFSGLTSMEKLEVLNCMHCVNYHRGEEITKQGVLNTIMYLVIDGCVIMSPNDTQHGSDDRAVPVGSEIGAYHLVRNTKSPHKYIAERPTLCLYLSREELVSKAPHVFSKLLLTMNPENIFECVRLPQARRDKFADDIVPRTMEEAYGCVAKFNTEVERDALFAAEHDLYLTKPRVGKSARRYSRLFFGSSFAKLSTPTKRGSSQADQQRECIKALRLRGRSLADVKGYQDLFHDHEALRILSLGSPEARNEILQKLRYSRIKKGSILFNPGEVVPSVFFILRGTINAVFHSVATSRLLAVINAGDVIGMWAAQDVEGMFKGMALYSAIASDNLELATLNIRQYHAIPAVRNEIMRRRTCLRSMKHLQLPLIDPLVFEMKMTRYPKGYPFITATRMFDNRRLYFVLEGEIVVRNHGKDITVLGAGEILSRMDADPRLEHLELDASGRVLLASFEEDFIRRLDPVGYDSICASSSVKCDWRMHKALGEAALEQPQTLMDEYLQKKAKGCFAKHTTSPPLETRKTVHRETLMPQQHHARNKGAQRSNAIQAERKELIDKALDLTIAHYSSDTQKRHEAICADWVKADLLKYDKRKPERLVTSTKQAYSCKASEHWNLCSDSSPR